MNVSDIIHSLNNMGISVTIEGADLRIKGPRDKLTGEVREILKTHKESIRVFLQQAPMYGQSSEEQPIPVIPREGDIPLSFAQQRLWFLTQLSPSSSAYNITVAVKLEGRLDLQALDSALEEITRRHEILRTTFPMVGGQPVQRLHPQVSWCLAIKHLAQLPPTERKTEMLRIAAGAQEPFDLARGPLFRATLVRLAETEHVILLEMHHIITDAWSMGVLIRELSTLYAAFTRGAPSPLPPLTVQYADYSVWQRNWLAGPAGKQQLAYWREKLKGIATMELPTDRPRPPVQSFRGAEVRFELSKDLSDQLTALALKEGMTLFMVLLAAFQVLLYRHSGQTDIAVGVPIANRYRIELEGMLGFFVNSLVVRSELSGNPSFRRLAQRVKQDTLEAYAHQNFPFNRLVEELAPARDASRSPLFQVMFALQNAPRPELVGADLQLTPLEIPSKTAKFDLSCWLHETGQGIRGVLEYNTDLFDAATAKRIAERFERLLEGIATNPDTPIAALPIITAAERLLVLETWNATRTDYPRSSCVHELFEQQVARAPESVAASFGAERLTYRELDQRANRLASGLRSLGVEPEVRVAVCVERSLDMLVALIGILKAGGAYVPLDVEYPEERLSWMLQDSRARVIVTQRSLANNLPASDLPVVLLDGEESILSSEPVSSSRPAGNAHSLAYIMYTSGSTGQPKGVEIEHRAIVRLACSRRHLSLAADDVVLQYAPLAFDASTFEIWVPLLHGASVAIALPGVASIDDLGEVLQRHGVTTLWLTAPLFRRVIDSKPSILANLRYLLAGGDALSPRHVATAVQQLPGCRIINGYGPTESTTFACMEVFSPSASTHGTVPIGTPLDNTRVYVLDDHLEPVPIGVIGELYIGGDGLARGYLDRPALTEEKFIPDRFGGSPGARLYRTGDLVRWTGEGKLEFLGRCDRQVKIRGFRVELGEVEAALARHPLVRDAAVLAREDVPGDKRLYAYVVAGDDSSSQKTLHEYLKAVLPEYMVPSSIIVLETFPLTPNGKVDRAALPVPNALAARNARIDMPHARDRVEFLLLRRWEELLGISPIGIDQSFFDDLGGHSLLAVTMMTQIERDLGLRLTPAILFRYPTIEKLAALLREGGAMTRAKSVLVPIQPEGARQPLFLVHPIGGNTLCYAALARHMSADQPLYGLEAQGLDEMQLPHSSIEDMAAVYVTAVRDVQPQGPYVLGGWSMGGVIAFEMARQLVSAGQEVKRVVMIDSWVPALTELAILPPDEDVTLLEAFAMDLGRMLGKQIILSRDELMPLAPEQQWELLLERARAAGIMLPSMGISEVRKLIEVFQANATALRHYVPEPGYSGQVVLFQASQGPSGDFSDGADGWGSVITGPIERLKVAGNHYTMLSEPDAKNLAMWIQDLIAT